MTVAAKRSCRGVDDEKRFGGQFRDHATDFKNQAKRQV